VIEWKPISTRSNSGFRYCSSHLLLPFMNRFSALKFAIILLALNPYPVRAAAEDERQAQIAEKWRVIEAAKNAKDDKAI